MDKVSYYNVTSVYQNNTLVYNTLTNSLICLSNDEYETIKSCLNDLESFQSAYPVLYEKLKKSGFIVDEDFDELAYIRLMNNKAVYENQRYHLTINPTLDCNLKCWYCSTEYAKTVHQGCMSNETAEAVKKHISNLITHNRIPSLHLDWFGGEPLMYYNEIVEPISKYAFEAAKENKVMFTQHVTTNSVFMTDKMMESMAELHFDSFQITVDGNERHHNLIKHEEDKTGTFAKIINNLNTLPEANPRVSIILRINYDKQTLKNIVDIIPLISENAKKHITVDFQKVWQIKTNEHDNKLLSTIRAAFVANGFKTNFWALSPKAFHTCYADRLHQYTINYDGKVFKCTAQGYGEDKVIGELVNDGNIKWNNKLLPKLFAQNSFDNPQCVKCKLFPACMGPCIIKNYCISKKCAEFQCFNDNIQSYADEYLAAEAQRRNLI